MPGRVYVDDILIGGNRIFFLYDLQYLIKIATIKKLGKKRIFFFFVEL